MRVALFHAAAFYRHAAACGRLRPPAAACGRHEERERREWQVCCRAATRRLAGRDGMRRVYFDFVDEHRASVDLERGRFVCGSFLPPRGRLRPPAAAMRSVSDENDKFVAERRGRGSAPGFGREHKRESSPRPQPALLSFSDGTSEDIKGFLAGPDS